MASEAGSQAGLADVVGSQLKGEEESVIALDAVGWGIAVDAIGNEGRAVLAPIDARVEEVVYLGARETILRRLAVSARSLAGLADSPDRIEEVTIGAF